jgi:Cu2+-exporting ATPase
MSAIAIDRIHTLWNDRSHGRARAVFAAKGIRCASCSRTVEKAVRQLPGIENVDVNVATGRVCVDWDAARTRLPDILAAVDKAGFQPVPLIGERAATALARERRAALKRIGLAGLGMMQVMMYVLGIYVARPESIDPAIASYLRYVGLLITTPVLVYSGGPFFAGAWRNLRERALGMDVPVALALTLAYAASVFNTLRGSGQTYFDSVTMFIFFLSAGRYLEMVVRQQSLSLSEAVARSLPSHVSRVTATGSTERIPLERVSAGDRILVPRGAVVPVDSTVADTEALVDESLVTGESRPERKPVGGTIPGGAVNVGAPIQIIASCDASSSTLASIVALVERAQGVRPRLTRAADRVANGFIAAILLIAIVVAAAWIFVDSSRAFPAALAVLVVTCPCALSLATPVAVAAASTRLARSGLLTTRADALERLAQVDTVVLDKTGTLTLSDSSIAEVDVSAWLTPSHALAIAAALERASAHPLAAVFAPHADAAVVATDVVEYEGRGIEGQINGDRWRLGKRAFVSELAGALALGGVGDDLCLANAAHEEAVFKIGERVRPEAQPTVQALNQLGVRAVIASGDQQSAVTRVAQTLGIEDAHARLSPADKTELVDELQSDGHRVLMLGDGVNDGPVLAAAHVSCAMGRGSAIAQSAADFLLLNDSLQVVAEGIRTARRMGTVIKQNLFWALLYNAVAIPLAALDWVPPWLAALGMSASSLFVVLNARRLAGERS